VATLDLTTLDPAVVAATEAEIVAAVTALLPQVDLRRGVVHDLVLQVAAVLAAADRTDIARLRASNSLLAISANPALSDPTLVDRVLSNYFVTRQPAGLASGSVTVIMSQATPTVVASGAVFADAAVLFATTQSFAIRATAAEAVGTGDRALVPMPDGNFAFTIPVVALVAGSAGSIRMGTPLLPSTLPPAYVAAYAAGDFTGGVAAETNAAVLARLQAGVAAKTWGNRVNIDALVRAQATFGSLLQLSIVGFGDPELSRDRRSIFPMAHPGRCDIYAQTAASPVYTPVPVTATLTGIQTSGGVWQASIGRDSAPGFYDIAQVLRVGSSPATAGYGVLLDARGLDLTGVVSPPDIASAAEAVYSRFQTSVIQFLDTDTPTAGLTVGTSTAIYTVVCRAMPLIGSLQDFLGSRDIRPPAGDVLVKAPVPCTLLASFELRCRAGSALPDTLAIGAAMAGAVASVGFSGRLDASTLLDAALPFLPAGCVLGGADLFGTVRRPDGTLLYLRSPDALLIPNDPSRGVTPRTTVFLLNAGDVTISLRAVAAPDL
jgi:hypothetical protein